MGFAESSTKQPWINASAPNKSKEKTSMGRIKKFNANEIYGYQSCEVVNGIAVRKHQFRQMTRLLPSFGGEISQIVRHEYLRGKETIPEVKIFNARTYSTSLVGKTPMPGAEKCMLCGRVFEPGDQVVTTFNASVEHFNVGMPPKIKYRWCPKCADKIAYKLLSAYGIKTPDLEHLR